MSLYRRPKFLEVIHEIREAMSREADYDIDLFAETVRLGRQKNSLLISNLQTDSEQLNIDRQAEETELPKIK